MCGGPTWRHKTCVLHMREKSCPAGWEQPDTPEGHWAATEKPKWRAAGRQHEMAEGSWGLDIPVRLRGGEGSIAEFW